ncbi:hypothetical protein TNCV_250281 [Trichonephila clavipes]|nr:hypothetical protein TNCV_250281 [Trichonephila clavipes]
MRFQEDLRILRKLILNSICSVISLLLILIQHLRNNSLDLMTCSQAKEVGEFNDLATKIAEKFWPGPLSIVVPLKENANVRSLRKLAHREEFEGDTECSTATYIDIREDASTGLTY